jgi:hypothetical protein
MLGILMSALCFADPQFAALEEGEPAPFAGRLLNDEAIVKISIEDQFKAQQCEIQIEYEKQKLEALHSYELEKLKIKLESDNAILKNKIELRDERIKDLQKLTKPTRPIILITSGFIIGTASTIATTYAVNQ